MYIHIYIYIYSHVCPIFSHPDPGISPGHFSLRGRGDLRFLRDRLQVCWLGRGRGVPWGCPGRPGKPSHGTSPFKQQPYKYGKSPILLNQDISIYI